MFKGNTIIKNRESSGGRQSGKCNVKGRRGGGGALWKAITFIMEAIRQQEWIPEALMLVYLMMTYGLKAFVLGDFVPDGNQNICNYTVYKRYYQVIYLTHTTNCGCTTKTR